MKHKIVFGGQAKWKMASGRPKYMKQNCGKWNSNSISASQKPALQDESFFRIDKKKQTFPRQKSTSPEASPLCAPKAPRNTTSYIIQAKISGGLLPEINTRSPYASTATSKCLNTQHYTEGIVEQIDQAWGVDSYGSMKGLLRVRHINQQCDDFVPNSLEILDEKVEQRMDQDLSRFETVYLFKKETGSQILETRINDQDNQIAYLEGESTFLKERMHDMEQELGTLKRRMRLLEGCNASGPGEICSGEASFA